LYSDDLVPGLAVRYNDKSCLENMHASACFDVMRVHDRKCDVLKNLSTAQYLEVTCALSRYLEGSTPSPSTGLILWPHTPLSLHS
jgi:hypothetical protein